MDNMLRFLLATALAITAPAFHAEANDGYGQLGLGGVIVYGKTQDIAMRKEVLEISADRVSVEYEFFNESDRDITLPVVFPLPPYPAIMPSFTWSGQPKGFKFRLNGKERSFKTHIAALLPSDANAIINVTDKLAAIGLTREQIAHFPGAFPENDVSPFRHIKSRTRPITATQIDQLRKQKLVREGPSGEHDFPVWNTSVTYSWTVAFPARQVTKIAHVYMPFRSGGAAASLLDGGIQELESKYCADKNVMTKMRKAVRNIESLRGNHLSGYGIAGVNVDYILTTANTWKGPIQDFTLRLKKKVPEEIISLCFPGSFVKIAPLTLESRIKDFTPAQELSIRFINPNLGDLDPRAKPWSSDWNSPFEPPQLR